MAHGAGPATAGTNPVWLAWVGRPADAKAGLPDFTTVLLRENFGSSSWRALQPIPSRVVAITSHRGELVVLLNNRKTWAWFSASSQTSGERFSYGPMLPQKQAILAIAGDNNSLWALGESIIPASAPSTQPGAPTLYSLTGETWTARGATWPAGVDLPETQRLSMLVIRDAPFLAAASGDGFIHLLQFSAKERQWNELRKSPFDVAGRQPFKLLNIHDRPALWIAGKTPAMLGAIHTLERPTPISLPKLSRVPDQLDLTVAGDQIWVLFQSEQKRYQQRLGLDGSESESAPVQISAVASRSELPKEHWFTIGIMTVLTLLILSTLLRRRAQAPPEDENDETDE